jgi:bifunctional non-homologous end joining protein LigD
MRSIWNGSISFGLVTIPIKMYSASEDKRKGKIYLDHLQNRKGQTLAAPYCVRPIQGATVSAPLEWKEVKAGLKMGDYTIFSMPERLKAKPNLFLGVLGDGINLEEALGNLMSMMDE